MEGLCKTPASVLNEMMAKQGITPLYELIVDGSGTHQPTFTYKISCDKISALGTGRCKKIAKQDAAEAILKKLKLMEFEEENSESLAESPKRISEIFDEEEMQRFVDQNSSTPENQNLLQQLLKLCHEHALTMPEFMVTASGLPHAPHFTVRCKVANYVEEGFAKSKKTAKRDAVQKMLERLEKVKDPNVNLHETVYSTLKLNNNTISDGHSIFQSDSNLTKREIYLLNASDKKLQESGTSNNRSIPREIEDQLIVVKTSIEKLLSLI